MALPTIDDAAVAEVEADEAQGVRDAAVAEVTTTLPEPVVTTGTAVAEAKQPEKAYDPMQFLRDQGIDTSGFVLDFTSFPTVVLDKGQFKVEGANIGTELEFMYMQHRKMYLFRGEDPADKDADPELCYTDDKITQNGTGRAIADIVAEWREKGLTVSDGQYYIVQGKEVGGERDDEIVQLQLSKTSMGKFDGFLVTLAIKRINPKTVVIKTAIGDTLGSGKRTWNPWTFSLAAK